MKTTKENINHELEELNASFLLNHKKRDVKTPDGLNEQILSAVKDLSDDNKDSKTRNLVYFMSGLAASLILGFFIFTQITSQKPTNQFSWDKVNKEDILLYIEDDLTNYTEVDLLTLVNTRSSENLFDNSGITDEFLEEHIFNQLNEEIQLEDLL